MDTSDITEVILAFCIGFVAACLIIGLVFRRVDRRRKRLTLDLVASVDRYKASAYKDALVRNGDELQTLRNLESGNIEAARHSVSMSIAGFYHFWG